MEQLLNADIETYNLEKRYYQSNGTIIWTTLNVSLARDEEGQPLYYISQIRDVTERKRRTEIIRNQNTRLLNFAYIVSHNLRSHTGNINMLTDMVIQEENTLERQNLLDMLKRSSGSLVDTLDDLNEVVKVQEGVKIEPVPLNLGDAVQRVLDILGASLKQAGANVSVQIPRNLHVKFNASYLESVIMNLVSNSLKYREASRTLEIDITAKQTEQHIVLFIADNGIGIDLSRHGNKLFGMYNTFHDHPDARGMGLYLTKSQVEAMGGTIVAESALGYGTTFTIQFNRQTN